MSSLRSDENWKAQIDAGGLIPDYQGAELWDCTDERNLKMQHSMRRRAMFGQDPGSFALAGGREGFSLLDFSARAAQYGEENTQSYIDYLRRTGANSPFIAHSIGLATRAQYGRANWDEIEKAKFNDLYGFFRKMDQATLESHSFDAFHTQRNALVNSMMSYDAAILNTHSDDHYEGMHANKITANGKENVGCAFNQLVGAVAFEAADERSFEAADKIGHLMGTPKLPIEKAARGLRIVARLFNINEETYHIDRESLVHSHSHRYKPADIILAGSHMPTDQTSMIVDGGNTARNIMAQTKHSMNNFMANPVKVAVRLRELSQYGEDIELTIALAVLQLIAVRNFLCGKARLDDPAILPIRVTPIQYQSIYDMTM